MTKRVLNTVVFMGSSRDIAPPWGGDSRLGNRVLAYVKKVLESREQKLGEETVTHSVTVYDPLEVFAEGGALFESGAEMKHPHHFFKAGTAPAAMTAMQETIKAADCYVVVTCEYNHSIPPALSGMMGHFGGSNYALKPSATVCYSPGPFGGARVAMALRPFLSELGCLPVSKLTLFPEPGNLFQEDGVPKDPSHRMLNQLPAMLSELEWMAVAMRNQKDRYGPPQ